MGKINEEAGGKYTPWLILGTAASKTFNFAGLQNADIIIPDAERRQAYREQLAVYHVFDSFTFGLIAEEAAYRYGEEWLDQLLPYLEGNLDYSEEQIAGRVPGAKVFRNDATYLAWMDCRKWQMTDELNHFFKCEARLGTVNCEEIMEKWRTEEERCFRAVLQVAEEMEETLKPYEESR